MPSLLTLRLAQAPPFRAGDKRGSVSTLSKPRPLGRGVDGLSAWLSGRAEVSRRHLVFVFFGAVVLSFVLYGNSIPGEFVYDDHLWADRTELREPEHLLKLWTEPYLPAFPHAGIWRPFSVFTYALNFVVFGDSPVSFHVFSILLNGITTFLVFLLV